MRLTRTNRIIFLQIALRTSILIKKNKLSFFLHSISFDLLKFFQQVDYNILKYNGARVILRKLVQICRDIL